LGNFPKDTQFFRIDEVDQCDLFLTDFSKNTTDPFDYQNFHVAIWHEDLIELHEQGLIVGMRLLTDYEAAVQYYESMKSNPSFLEDGKLILPEPMREMFDEPDKAELQIMGGISLSEDGRQQLLDFSSTPKEPFYSVLESRISPLIRIGYYDTAVREGCLLIECKLKDITSTDNYGQTLVDCFFKQWKDSEGGYTTPSWKILRGELRTIVKFLRNYYAHNCVIVDAKQAFAILARISRILEALDIVNWKT
jgi:hypothetical protein